MKTRSLALGLLIAAPLCCQTASVRLLDASGRVESLDWSRDGSMLAVFAAEAPHRGAPSTIEIWNVATGKRERKIGRTRTPSTAARFSPDASTVAYASWWQEGLLPRSLVKPPSSQPSRWIEFDATTGKRQRRIDGAAIEGLGVDAASADMLCLRISPNARFAAAGGKLVDRSVIEGGHIGGALVVWDLQTGAVAWHDHTTHTGIVQSVAFSPDGTLLATGGDDQLIRIWDAPTGRLQRTFVGLTWGGVNSLAFSPDGHKLATGGTGREEGGMVRIWGQATGRIEHTISPVQNAFARGTQVRIAFAVDGSKVFAVGRDRGSAPARWRVSTVEVASGRVLEPLLAPRPGFARAIEAAPDGKHLAIATAAGEVVLIDLGQ